MISGSYNYPGMYRMDFGQTTPNAEFSATSSFTGGSYTVVAGPFDVSKWTNLAITVVNNHATNVLASSSIEFSPNGTSWETDWNTGSFSPLGVGVTRSMQISENSRKYLRVRSVTSGSAGALTGSVAVYVSCNNG